MPYEKFSVLDDAGETLKSWQRKLEYLFNKNLDSDNVATSNLTLGPAQVKASNIDFGTGADQVDASDILIIDAGGYYVGSNVELALQELGFLITNTTSNMTLASSNRGYIMCNATTGITVTLPAVSGNAKLWYNIRNINTGTVTIETNSTDLIDNSTSFDLYASESIDLINTGLQWREG